MTLTPSLLTHALSVLTIVPVGTEFTVRDLFLGFYWDALPIADRMHLGTSFFHAIQDNTTVKPIHKTHDNQQVYEKL